MLYLYCDRRSDAAAFLTNELEAKRIRHFDGLNFYGRRGLMSPEPGDTILCWGTALPDMEDIRVINGGFFGNKLDELKALNRAGLNCPSFTEERPRINLDRWFGRRLRHQAGRDFLDPPTMPGY